MSEKVYGICENKCLKEVPTKEEIEKVQKETLETSDGKSSMKATFRRSGNVVCVEVEFNVPANTTFSFISAGIVAPSFANWSGSAYENNPIRGHIYDQIDVSSDQYRTVTLYARKYGSDPNTAYVKLIGSVNNNDPYNSFEGYYTMTYIVD